MHTKYFHRLAGLALVLAGILIPLFWILHPDESLLLTRPADYQLEHTLGFAGALLLPIGLLGLYARLAARQESVIGLVGFLLAFFSALLSLAVSTVDFLVWPAIAGVQPDLILDAAGRFDQISPVFLLTYNLVGATLLLVVLGYSLLGIALWRAAVVPRTATALQVLGALLSAFAPSLVPHDALAIKLVIYGIIGIALIWLGLFLWQAAGRRSPTGSLLPGLGTIF